MAAKRAGVCVAVLVVLCAACGSSDKHADTPSNTQPKSVLAFREVLGTMPYATTTAATAAGTLKSCEGGRLVTRAATPDSQVILADRDKKNCYALGPTLLTGANVDRADAVINPTTDAWEVNVRFENDDFVQKIAVPEVGKEVAVVLDGVVESAPKINPGITGRDVTISGTFDQATARHIAAEIDPSSTTRPPETSTTTFYDTLAKRCDVVRSTLGHLSGSTTVTAANARSALERAHQPVPGPLQNIDGAERLALCEFVDPNAKPTPTTVCPNGTTAPLLALESTIDYAVDAKLTAYKLPAMKYLLPPGVPIPASPDLCAISP